MVTTRDRLRGAPIAATLAIVSLTALLLSFAPDPNGTPDRRRRLLGWDLSQFMDPRSVALRGGNGQFVDIFADPAMPSALAGLRNGAARPSSPRYEVNENRKQLRLAVDVPGVKLDDVNVELEDDNHVLHISGGRKVNTYDEYKFDEWFNIGRDLDTSRITAHLSDGVLVVTAPKKEELPPSKRDIPILQGEAPALMDEEEENAPSFLDEEEEKND